MTQDGEAGFQAVIGGAADSAHERELIAFGEDVQNSLARAGCSTEEARRLATIRVVAALLCSRAASDEPLDTAGEAIARAAQFTGLPEAAVQAMVGHVALRDMDTVARPPLDAIRLQLEIAASLAALRQLTLWLSAPDGSFDSVTYVRGRPPASAEPLARETFETGSQTPVDARRELVAVPLTRGPLTFGAMTARAPRGRAGVATMTLRAATPLIAKILQRKVLLESAEARGAGAAERALTRFSFDVHDGPAQEIAALQAEIRSLEGQVAEAFAKDPRADLLLGRLDDLEARSAAVAQQIRALASSAGSPASADQPVEEILRAEMEALQEDGMKGDLQLSGPVDDSTPSQRIALVRGIQEALRNVREHSQARNVHLRVTAGEDCIDAEIRDDGCGFDPEQATNSGRMGLAGIAERARLIGGSCEIISAEGGPTAIRMSLPRWAP